jgi:protein-tyrosine-phosphatase
MARPQPLSQDEAKEKILLILSEGIYDITEHCRRDSMTRRNVSDDDIIIALENGEVQDKPEWEDNHQNWKYKVVGRDTDNDKLTLITVIIEKDLTLRIITVW